MRFSINAIGYLFVVLFVILGVLLLIIPIGHTGDGWGYAADVVQANSWWSPELVSAHHLFYNYLCYALNPIFISYEINPINGFTAVNWIFYGLTIFVFYKSLLGLGYNINQSLLWSLLIAGCFGSLRFSLENETYIQPLFFALMGSHVVWNFNNLRSYEYLGFVFLAISVLFHQSYIFWFMAFVVNAIYRGRFFAPLLAILIILSFYFLFAIKEKQPILSFILHDVNNGLVQISPNLNNFKFTLINGFRTLFQIHGTLLILLENWTVLSIIGISGAALFFVGIVNSLQHQNESLKWKKKNLLASTLIVTLLQNPFFLAFILQLGFAFYSVGNAEFMAMLPMLFLLSFHDKVIPLITYIRLMVFGIWIYNAVFFITPTFRRSFDDIGLTSKMLLKEVSAKPFVFISTNAKAIQNQIAYEETVKNINAKSKENTSNLETSNSKAKGEFLLGQNVDEIHLITKALLDPKMDVYTDNSIIFNKISGGSRAAMLINPQLKNELLIKQWRSVRVDSFKTPQRKLELFKMVRGVTVSH